MNGPLLAPLCFLVLGDLHYDTPDLRAWAEKADGDAVTLDAERSAAENADMLWERIEQICV